MARGSAGVDELLAALDHPLAAGIERLRSAIRAAEPDLVETVKWKAPNYRYAGEDRITFRLAPRGQLQLILHRGRPSARTPATSGSTTRRDC
ncbi:DUF1801 domain-containing protein [Actinomycetospora sp. CA-101289]|uniref:DUF1801 domain-containing protein n=1 Tax=Actinomycetospora sp. CA-101289 TaxID=3239893 RepID=UPI003D95365E